MREVLCGLVIGLCVGIPIGAMFCAWFNMESVGRDDPIAPKEGK